MPHLENCWFKYRTCRMQLATSKFNVGSGTLLPRPVLKCHPTTLAGREQKDFADMYSIK